MGKFICLKITTTVYADFYILYMLIFKAFRSNVKWNYTSKLYTENFEAIVQKYVTKSLSAKSWGNIVWWVAFHNLYLITSKSFKINRITFLHIQIARRKNEMASSNLNRFLEELWISVFTLNVSRTTTVPRLVTKLYLTVLAIYMDNGN